MPEEKTKQKIEKKTTDLSDPYPPFLHIHDTATKAEELRSIANEKAEVA